MPPQNTSAPLPIRLMLVDDQAVVREGLRLLLETQPDLKVVAEASNRQEAMAAATREHTDVVLLDLDLGGESGLDCLTELLTISTQARILILTGSSDLDMHFNAICYGAMGLVQKSESSQVLVNAIKKVHSGEVWLNSAIVTRLLNEMWRTRTITPVQSLPIKFTALSKSNGSLENNIRQQPQLPDSERIKIARLTDRERELVALVGEGLRNKQIADRLFISVTTVRHHLSSIFDKLEVGDRFELAIYSYRHGLAKLPL